MNTLDFAQIVQISLLQLWEKVLNVLPDILGAVIIILIGFIVAPIFGGIVKKIIDLIKIDQLAEKVGLIDVLKPYFKKPSISLFVGKLVKWFFVIAFFMAAAEVLSWNQVTEFLNKVILYIPNVLIAVVILVIGAIAGKFLQEVVVRSVEGSNAPIKHPKVLGNIANIAIMVFAILAALIQLGIAPSLIQILFAGIVLAMALAFGLGGQKKASQLLDYIDGSK